MNRVKWPKITYQNPADPVEHAATLLKDLDAISEYVQLSAKSPSTETKKQQGAENERVATQRSKNNSKVLQYGNTLDRDEGSAMGEAKGGRSAGVPKYLFDIIHNSFLELHGKLAASKGESNDLCASQTSVIIHSSDRAEPSATDNDTTEATPMSSDTQPRTKQVDDTLEQGLSIDNIQGVSGVGPFDDDEIVSKVEEMVRITNQELMSSAAAEASANEQDVARKPEPMLTGSFVLGVLDECIIDHIRNMTTEDLFKIIDETIRESCSTTQAECYNVPQTYAARKLNSGDIRVQVQAETDGDLETFKRNTSPLAKAFTDHFNIKTIPVMMHGIRVNSMRLQDPVCKIRVIEELVGSNSHITSLTRPNDIRDIHWLKQDVSDKYASTVVFDVLTRTQANEIMEKGLFWDKRVRECAMLGSNHFLSTCQNCQRYKHSASRCVFPPRCGLCAAEHLTENCRSAVLKCADCGGGHSARSEVCPTKMEIRTKQRGFRHCEMSDEYLRSTQRDAKDIEPQLLLSRPIEPSPVERLDLTVEPWSKADFPALPRRRRKRRPGIGQQKPQVWAWRPRNGKGGLQTPPALSS